MSAGLSAGVAFIDILPNMTKFTTSLSSGMRRAGQSMMNVGRTLTHAITVPVALAAAASVKMSLDFSSAMVRIRTQAGASEGEVQRMKKAVLDLAPAVATGPNQLAAGLYHVESVGYRSAKALEVLKTAALGAKVGGSDLESTASALSAVLVTNIKGTKNYANAMGILNGIVGSGNMRMQDLVQGLKSGVVPTAKVAGLSLRGIGAALAMMTDEGVPATTAAMRLRTVLFMITDPTKKALGALKSIGLHAKSLGHDMQQPDGLNVAMMDLKKHLADIKDPTQRLALIGSMFGGSRSAGTIAMLLNNLGRIHMKYQQISKVAGHYQSLVERTRATPQFKIDQAWAAVQVSLIKTGAILLPIVATLANTFARWVTTFSEWSTGAQKVVVYGALILAALGPLVALIGTIVTVAGVLVTTFQFIGVALMAIISIMPGVDLALADGAATLTAFGGALDLSLGPLGLFVLGVTALGIAAGAIYEYLSSSSTATDQLTGASNRAISAVNGLNSALDNSRKANENLKQARHQETDATLAVKRAQEQVNKLYHDGKKGTLDYKSAVASLNDAKDNLWNAEQRTGQAVAKARVAHEAATKATKADHKATTQLIGAYYSKIRANDKLIQSWKGQYGMNAAVNDLQKKNKANIDKVTESIGKMQEQHLANAKAQMEKGNPAMAATERHLAKVDGAVVNLVAKLGHMPTFKQIDVELAIEAMVNYTGANRAKVNPNNPGYVAPPPQHTGKTPHPRKGKGSAAGGPLGAYEPSIVGELGPELYVPRVAGTVIPNHMLGLAGGGGRMRLTIDNWHEGTGYIESVADETINQAGRHTRRIARMNRS